jgi:hypothetical protein
MTDKSAEDVLDEVSDLELSRFKWIILKYICEMSDRYSTFPESELFHKTNLKGFIDENYGQHYLHSKRGTLYKLLMDRIMNCLKDRDTVEIAGNYGYGDSEIIVYKPSQNLKDKCEKSKKYEEMADMSRLDEFFPKVDNSDSEN